MRYLLVHGLVVLGVLATLLVMGSASAREAAPAATTVEPTLVAIAIGQLVETDGESATVDLRATRHEGQTFGALRFYAPDHGYYNGAVRTLAVESGRITATGGGVLVEPDGRRRLVRFTATIPLDGKAVSIAVQGFQGFAYTLAGDLKPGFVQAGAPGQRASATN